MATIVVTASGGDRAWSTAATWVGGTPAGAGDTARFDGNSGNVFVDGNVADLTGLDMTGYTNTLMFVGAYTLDVDGNVTLEGSTASSGNASEITISGNLTVVSGFTFVDPEDMTLTLDGTGTVLAEVTLPKVIVNTAGTHTLDDPVTVGQSLTLTAGTFAGAAYALTVADFTLAGGTFTGSGAMAISGDLTYSAGTNTHTGTWTHSGASNAAWNTTSQQIVDYRLADGATIDRTAIVYVKKLVIPATASLSGANMMYMRFPTANNFISIAEGATITGSGLTSRFNNSFSNVGEVHIPGLNWLYYAAMGQVWTQTGKLVLGSLSVRGWDNGDLASLILSSGGNVLGDIIVGTTGVQNRNGHIDFVGSSVKIGDVTSGNAANLANAIDFGSAYVELQNGKTINGDNIAITADDGAAHIVGIGTATVTNVEPTAATDVIHCHECVDGTGNTVNRVTFDEHAHPGSLLLTGVGI